MPNHWESSARPLFVRTVFVNGHRHAILFEEDPLINYGNSTHKKISRSNSSLSSASDHSLTSSESQDSNSDEKVSRLPNSEQRQRKDLSSELQSCLINHQLSSANLENGVKSGEEKCFCHSKEPDKSQKEIPKQKRYKCKRNSVCRRKHYGEHFEGESKENKLFGKSVNKNGGCYFYNYESGQRKKNYCVVKISSQPPKFTLSCRCDLSDTQKCKTFQIDKSKMLISATIHNLFMATRKDHLFDNKADNIYLCDNIDSIDLYLKNYITGSHYNSLSERVFQWLDLATKKKKQKQKLNTNQDEDSSNSTERIFSGKTFICENKKTEPYDISVDKRQNQTAVKKKEVRPPETSQTEVKAGVLQGENKNLVYFGDKLKDDSQESSEEETTKNMTTLKSTAGSNESPISPVRETHSNSSSESIFKKCTTPTKTSLRTHDLVFDYNSRGNFDTYFEERSTQKMRGTHESSTFRNKQVNPKQIKELFSTEEEEYDEEEDDKEKNVVVKPLKYWEKKTVRKTHQFDASGKQTSCHCNGNFDEFADKINNELLTKGLAEKHQKSINNLNITRAQPVLIQNLLPSRQQNEISNLRTEKAVWGLEKDTKRPQLHIFMPSLLLKETSDDSMSECENILNLY